MIAEASVEEFKELDADEIAWKPIPGAQELFLSCPHRQVIFSGSRGPGKTDALLMDFAQHIGKGYGAVWRGILFRRVYKELGDVVEKSARWFYQMFPGTDG